VAVTGGAGAPPHATELGGQVAVPPADAPPGRLAVISDPQGATLTIIKLAGEGAGG
jgi:predicted enzyme related to lactoylglutathione lyase